MIKHEAKLKYENTIKYLIFKTIRTIRNKTTFNTTRLQMTFLTRNIFNTNIKTNNKNKMTQRLDKINNDVTK